MFLHIIVNNFTGKQWGEGTESPDAFIESVPNKTPSGVTPDYPGQFLQDQVVALKQLDTEINLFCDSLEQPNR